MKNFLKLLLFFPLILLSQDNPAPTLDDVGRIGFFTDVVTNDEFQGSAKQNVFKKIDRMLLKSSMGSSVDDRFGLVVVPYINTKEKTTTTPPKYFYDIDVNVYAVDYQEKTQLGLYTFDGLKGINANKQRALIASFRDFKPTRGFSEFIEDVKQKIIEYYNTQCDFIIKESETLASNDQFDEAITKLSSVPQISKNCFDNAQGKLVEIYQMKLERECQALVSEAESLIAQEQYKNAASVLKTILPGISCYDKASQLIKKVEEYWCNVNLAKAQSFKAARNFDQAARFLALVPLSSSCGNKATALSNEIYSELTALEQRDWEFKMKKYDDDQQMQRDEMSFELDRQRILSNAAVESAKALSKMKLEVKNYEFLGVR
jgi:hypothetical protein